MHIDNFKFIINVLYNVSRTRSFIFKECFSLVNDDNIKRVCWQRLVTFLCSMAREAEILELLSHLKNTSIDVEVSVFNLYLFVFNLLFVCFLDGTSPPSKYQVYYGIF